MVSQPEKDDEIQADGTLGVAEGFSLLSAGEPRVLVPANQAHLLPEIADMSEQDLALYARHIIDASPDPENAVYNILIALKQSRIQSYKFERKAIQTAEELLDAQHAIHEFKELIRHWEAEATTDELTKIPNRRRFMERLKEAVEEYRRHHFKTDVTALDHELGEYQRLKHWEAPVLPQPVLFPQYAVAMIDLDRFKDINDTHGHYAGDLALKAVAERLMHIKRGHEMASRLGGDEFALLLMGEPGEPDFALKAKQRLEKQLEGLYIEMGGEKIDIHCSVGVYHMTDPSKDVHATMNAADEAMYDQKQARRNQRTQGNADSPPEAQLPDPPSDLSRN